MIKLRLIKENKNIMGVLKGYHRTSRENYERIKEEGLRVNQKSAFLLSGHEKLKEIYGVIPIFISLDENFEEYKNEGDILLEVDLTGLKILPDVWSLVDHGAYIEQDGIWFEGEGPEPLSDWGDEFSYDDLLNDRNIIKACLEVTKTCAIPENIESSRIKPL